MANRNANALAIPLARSQTGLKSKQFRKFTALVRRTQVECPRASDIKALRQMLTETPDLWRALGDLAQYSILMVLDSECFSVPLRLSVQAGISDIQRDLGYADAPPLEKMLINQIIVTWVQLQKAQIFYETEMNNGTSLRLANYWERCLTMTQLRYLKACETLVRVRKLSRPSASIQLNIAKRQLNISQSAPSQPSLSNDPAPNKIIDDEPDPAPTNLSQIPLPLGRGKRARDNSPRPLGERQGEG